MVSQVLATIFRSGLNGHLDSYDALITDFEYLASYSWHDCDIPTISVPGFPPFWSPPAGRPLQLKPDSGRVYIDQNAARAPHAPLEPAFSALAIQNPDYDVGSVDVITDRNNIRKLLRFLQGTSSEYFQIRVEIPDGKTALFTRIEKETTTVIQGFQGYGRNFEKAYTKTPAGTSGYYRITSFRFGGLQCMVRNETDGYIGDERGRGAAQHQAKETEDLSKLVEKLQLIDSCSASKQTSIVTAKREGQEVDCSSIIELKTRAAGKSFDMNEIAAQLWISQTPHLATAFHKYGLFNDVEIQDMTDYVRNWERSNQKVLCNLANLLNQIIEVAKGSANQIALVSYEGGMKLDIIGGEQKNAATSGGVDPNCSGEKPGTGDNDLMAKTGDEYKPLAQTSTTSRAKTAITIGNVRYQIDVSRIPRLAALVLKSGNNSSMSQEIVHEAVPLFDIAIKGIESGYRQCFRLMSSDITPYRTLCDTYDFLQVDVCKGRTLNEIIQDLKAGQNYDEDRDKSKARDAAFKLVYSMLRDTFQSRDKDKNSIYNAVLFIASHPGTFKWKTRNSVLAIYENMFVSSVKQRANLNKWHKLDLSGHADTDDTDETTEGEDLYWYDSDSSDFC